MNSARVFELAWRIVPRLPRRLVEGLAGHAGTIVAWMNGLSVKQMRKNFEHLTGREPSNKEIRHAVQSYSRCYAQQFSLSGWSKKELEDSCVYPQAEKTRELMKDGPVVLALTHSGNWDLAGAWFCQNFGPIVTVAEKLDPPEVFEKFVTFRESLGMEIIGVGKNEHIFEKLVQQVEGRSVLVPLLADRDISGAGVEVTLGNSKALVAAGPAALALRLGCPLITGHIVYRKQRGRYNLKTYFSDPVPVPVPQADETLVEAYTRSWVQTVESAMLDGVVDWHMMQKLYVDDLDQERLQKAKARNRTVASGTDVEKRRAERS